MNRMGGGRFCIYHIRSPISAKHAARRERLLQYFVDDHQAGTLLAQLGTSDDKVLMVGLGKALRERAVALGLSDSEVARRLGMSQSRYHNYVSDTAEPDLATFLRICRVLVTSPDQILAFEEGATTSTSDALNRDRLSSALTALEGDTLSYAADLLEAMMMVHRDRLAVSAKEAPVVDHARQQSRSKKSANKTTG